MSTEPLLEERVFKLLRTHGACTAARLAQELNVEKRLVNAILYGALKKNGVVQDSSYRWSLSSGQARAKATAARAEVPSNHDLGRLARYYLACLSHDNKSGHSVWARNKYGNLDYVELPSLTKSPAVDLDAIGALKRRQERDRSRLQFQVGFPVFLKHFVSKKGADIYRLEPLFVFDMDFAGDGAIQVAIEQPLLNLAAWQSLSNSRGEEFLQEAVQFEHELGLTLPVEEQPELDDLCGRLQLLHDHWPWREDADPDMLDDNPHLSVASEPGLYNRAIAFLAERSPYTQGLEAELTKLSRVTSEDYKPSILSYFLSGSHIQPSTEPADSPLLLEVLPMNTEQRQAVTQALTQPLTVVTGPPGTGKSQVVSNIIFNAALAGQRVLFTSKNNHAVDVVETRVNEIGDRPILLRHGSAQYSSRLAEYLNRLLATKASETDHSNYRAAQQEVVALQTELQKLDLEQTRLVEKRNHLDQLDRRYVDLKAELRSDEIRRLAAVSYEEWRTVAQEVRQAVSQAFPKRLGSLSRILWRWKYRFHQKQLTSVVRKHLEVLQKASIPPPKLTDPERTQWEAYVDQVLKVASILNLLSQYQAAKADLYACRRLEDISSDMAFVQEQIADASERFWRCWLRILPDRLSTTDRQTLGQYVSVLQMVARGTQGGAVSRDVWRQYFNLSEKAGHLLPCWAVTSLSVKGRIPFKSGTIDLLIIDEASQCDIASVLPLLYRARRIVVIGDPQQLSHISTLSNHQDQKLLAKHGLMDNYLHWSYLHNSLFDLARSYCDSDSLVNLRDHHRSHADIIGFSNHHFYGNSLRIATDYRGLKLLKRSAAVRWINFKGRTERPREGGAYNREEAMAIIKTLNRLVSKAGYQGTIGVVTPFRAQVRLLEQLVKQNEILARDLHNQDLLIDTVHGFQGDERDLMIFSPVLSTGDINRAAGFMKATGNLFNVAITRARGVLLVVGDKAVCRQADIDYLKSFIQYCEELEADSPPESPVTAEPLGPDYPYDRVKGKKISEWEVSLYEALYAAGVPTIPQYPVEKYHLDLALLENGRSLDIEVDGEHYHRDWTGELCKVDQMRNQRMIELGWDVIRFWVYEVRDDLPGCVAKVRAWLDQDVHSAVAETSRPSFHQLKKPQISPTTSTVE